MGKSSVKLYQNLEIVDTSADGLGICKAEERVFFIPGTVPGDIIDAETWKVRSKFWSGRVVQFQKYSEQRAKPVCDHFGTCGGCKWQNMQYSTQLKYKQKMVADALERIGGIKTDILPILGSKDSYYYRNRLDFSFSNRRWLTTEEMGVEGEKNMNAFGFHVPRMFDRVIDIHTCHLMDPLNDTIRNGVREYAANKGLSFYDHKQKSGFLRCLIVRTTTTGECMALLMVAEADQEKIDGIMKHMKDQFPFITSMLYVINTKANDTMYDLEVHTAAGQSFITEEMEGLKFRVSPKSFYQTNPKQAYELYKIARDFAAIKSEDIVYDLYTGTGTIANFVARKAKHVIGVESVAEAIEAARENSKLNNINNTSFFAGEMRKVFNHEFISQNGKPDVIITDPPRAGMDEGTCQLLLELSAPRIVYVSCNPSTQARDLKILSEKYKVIRSQPVDMFPQTAHVENVALLELNS